MVTVSLAQRHPTDTRGRGSYEGESRGSQGGRHRRRPLNRLRLRTPGAVSPAPRIDAAPHGGYGRV